MAREAEIRKKAIQKLDKEGQIIWFSPKVKYKQTDIFGVFDLICWKKKKGSLKFIQLTTLSNLSTRRKKIQKFLKKHKINSKIRGGIKVEIWAWSQQKKTFKIEEI